MIYRLRLLRWGRWAAALAAGAWVLQPNLFGHGHYAAYDAVLTSLWVLAIIVFAQAVVPQTNLDSPRQPTRWGWTLTFGLVLGCAAATKFTGWFLPLPFLVWSCLYRSRPGFKTLLLGGLIAIGVLFALMPPWWTRSGQRRHSVPGIQPEPRQDEPHPGSVPRHRLQHAQGVAPVVQHAGLDRVRHAGRLLDHGGHGILGEP